MKLGDPVCHHPHHLDALGERVLIGVAGQETAVLRGSLQQPPWIFDVKITRFSLCFGVGVWDELERGGRVEATCREMIVQKEARSVPFHHLAYP